LLKIYHDPKERKKMKKQYIMEEENNYLSLQ